MRAPLAASLLCACGLELAGEPSPPSPEEQAKAVFAARCAPCHGQTGRGDGPVAKTLAPPPRDYTDPAWQRRTTNARLRRAIVGGGQAVGLSPAMPASPDLEGKPEVLEALVALIRSFARRPG